MMRMRSVVRDLVLLCLAVAIGWWARSANTAVMAQHSGSSSSPSSRGGGATGDPGLAFQMFGTGPNAALALYNPGNRTLYVYERAANGNSQVSCTYSYSIANPGAQIQRNNCPVGELVPQR